MFCNYTTSVWVPHFRILLILLILRHVMLLYYIAGGWFYSVSLFVYVLFWDITHDDWLRCSLQIFPYHDILTTTPCLEWASITVSPSSACNKGTLDDNPHLVGNRLGGKFFVFPSAWESGPDFIFSCIGIPIIKISLSWDHLVFTSFHSKHDTRCMHYVFLTHTLTSPWTCTEDQYFWKNKIICFHFHSPPFENLFLQSVTGVVQRTKEHVYCIRWKY